MGTDFAGDGASMTDSGYPRTVREWRRGTALSASSEVFAGEKTDVSVSGYVSRHGEHVFEWRERALTFYTSTYALRLSDSDQWTQLDTLPEDAKLWQFQNQLMLSLRSRWTPGSQTFESGALLAASAADVIKNGKNATFKVLLSTYLPTYLPASLPAFHKHQSCPKTTLS